MAEQRSHFLQSYTVVHQVLCECVSANMRVRCSRPASCPIRVKHTLHRAAAQSVGRLPLHLYPDMAAAPGRTASQSCKALRASTFSGTVRALPPLPCRTSTCPCAPPVGYHPIAESGFVNRNPVCSQEDHQRGVPQAGQPALGITHPGGLQILLDGT